MAPPPPAPRQQQDEGSDDEGMARGGKRMRFAKKDLSIQIPDAKKVRFNRDTFISLLLFMRVDINLKSIR